jgi:hypothetical protein
MLQIDLVELMLPGQLLKHYFLASYNYYQLDQSAMTDEAFDRLTVRLRECLLSLTGHEHIKLVSDEDLAAGTCLLAESKYPSIVRHTAMDYYAGCLSNVLDGQIRRYLKTLEKL